MIDDSTVVDINLAPGSFFFGEGRKRIHTLLGSCVAITIWHPRYVVGGMCHYLLATRGANQRVENGYYADDAVQMFLKAIREYSTKPQEYEVKLFGGSNMFESLGHKMHAMNVSRSNIESGPLLLLQNGFHIKSSDLGGNRYRKLYLELWNGDVWVQKG